MERLKKVRVKAANLQVYWIDVDSGYTLDSEGIQRNFFTPNPFAFNPEYSLTTQKGKEIKSTWKNTGIEANAHFYAIKESYHNHFIKSIESTGYLLQLLESDNMSHSYLVWKDEQKLGKITQHLHDRWSHNLQNSRIAAQFPTPMTCISDLAQKFAEKQAETAKFKAENVELAKQMLNGSKVRNFSTGMVAN